MSYPLRFQPRSEFELFLGQFDDLEELCDIYNAARTSSDWGGAIVRNTRAINGKVLKFPPFVRPFVTSVAGLESIARIARDRIAAETGMTPEGYEYYCREMQKD